VAIVALVLWVITAAAGVSLLGTGGAARRLAAETARASAETARTPAETAQMASAETARMASAETARMASAETARMAGTPARSAAVPLTDEGKPPPVPHVRVTAPPGEHPLLEFSHPALAITGLACWFMFVFVRYAPFAWISFGILVGAIALGLTWLARNAQAARRHVSAAWKFPPQLVVLHGAAAAIAITLTVLTALSASHG
jgi:hypothetical protein